MTGTNIVTQNVTTFIKNSANFENIFCQGFYADIPSNKKSRLSPTFFYCYFPLTFLFPSSRKHARMLSREMTMQTDQPRCHMPRAPKTTPTSRGASGIPISPAPAGKPCDDRRSGDCRFLRSALGCLNAWMLDCWDAWLFGCVTAGMLGCLAA